MAGNWAKRVEELTGVKRNCTQFLRYHANNDDSHMNKLYGLLDRICTHQQVANDVVLTATLSVAYTRCSSRKLTVHNSQARSRSPYIQVLAIDTSIPIDPVAVNLWLSDADNPLRWTVRPLLQFIFGMLLHITWLFKRLPLPQFRAHGLLQRTICWFCRNAVSPEANLLILRHFTTESNIINFLRDNSGPTNVPPIALYPQTIDDMLKDTFVHHDQELFRVYEILGIGTTIKVHALPMRSTGPTGAR